MAPLLLLEAEHTGKEVPDKSFSRMPFPDTPDRHAKRLAVARSPPEVLLNVSRGPSLKFLNISASLLSCGPALAAAGRPGMSACP